MLFKYDAKIQHNLKFTNQNENNYFLLFNFSSSFYNFAF